MKLVIVGNGVAGVTSARFVSGRDPSVAITIYSDERYPYYPRPRLIELLAGKSTPEQMALYPREWYEERGIRTILSRRVIDVRPEAHEIVLDDGATNRYDQLVLATGAHPWVPPIPGADLSGVYTLRSMRDALALREKSRQVRRAIILGGGLLGLDTSMALRANGLKVSVIEALPRLMPRQLDTESAGMLQAMIEAQGVSVVTGDLCAFMEGDAHVTRIRLQSGRILETDMVVVSAGIRPNFDLAQSRGLSCARGVLVDERMQTSHPDIYAVGDVAEFNGRVWGIIPAALAQARTAAAQILGNDHIVYQDVVPTTTLKVPGINLISIGEVNPEDEGFTQVRHIDPGRGIYEKLVLRHGRVVGAILIGARSDARAVTQLITRRIDVSGEADSLLTERFDLVRLLRGRDADRS